MFLNNHFGIRLKMILSKERKRHLERVQEHHESELIQRRLQIASLQLGKQLGEVIIDKIMKKLPDLIKDHERKIEPADVEEVSRRFSTLKKPFVTDCLKSVDEIFRYLRFSVSAAETVAQVVKIMTLRVILIPEIPPIQCELVKKCLSESIAQFIEEIKNERLKFYKNKLLARNPNDDVIGIIGTCVRKTESCRVTFYETVDFRGDIEQENNSDSVDFESIANSSDDLATKENQTKRASPTRIKDKFVCKQSAF